MTWAAYAQAAKDLSEVRRKAEEQHAEQSSVLAGAERDVERISGYLATQRNRLSNIARLTRLPEPHLGGIGRSSESDLGEALRRAVEAANSAESAASEAEERATQPALLPGLPPSARNGLIYAAWAFLGWLAQCVLVSLAGNANFGVALWSLCGLPAVAFFAGYLTISIGGQPRIAGSELPKNVRLGGVICFVGMPLAWLFLIAVMSFARN